MKQFFPSGLCALQKSFIFCLLFGFNFSAMAQVSIHDTIITWQHHTFELNADYSMKSFSRVDTDIQQVQFQAKVIENELIRLVIVPSYGARILSFIYKPTNHEYLYQSSCGTPYGINEGNFYYNWLMVWGGIFPTFPEPEHGKTWLIPWNFKLISNTPDTVRISMDYTDNSSFSGAPGGFNNGITNITCTVNVGVFRGSSAWDYDVELLNNKAVSQRYEYWTCTTMTPGSAIGKSASPLNSEMVIPITKYKAAWSPNSWIGSNGQLFNYSAIDFLSEWKDMGIAYASNFSSNYWGVINHDNNEGIFRVSDNIKTPGLKLWTWGKNSVNGDLSKFSTGAQFNYIELWAGASAAFFTDATLSANQRSAWKESYTPTVGLTGILKMDNLFAANILYNIDSARVVFQINAFQPNTTYRAKFTLEANQSFVLQDADLLVDKKGSIVNFDMKSSHIPNGEYQAHLQLFSQSGTLLFDASTPVSLHPTIEIIQLASSIKVVQSNSRSVDIICSQFSTYQVEVYNINGQLASTDSFSDLKYTIDFAHTGIYIIKVTGNGLVNKTKVVIM